MRVYLQNKVTGEIKEVIDGSQEYRDLIAERTAGNKPVWEIQSDTAVAARVERAEAGALRDTDLPKSAQLVPERNKVQDFAPAKAPWKELTTAEVELGLTPERKAEEEQRFADTSAQNANAQTKETAVSTILASETDRRGGQGVTTHTPASDADLVAADKGKKSAEKES